MKITKLEKKKRLYLLELDEYEKIYITEDTLVHFMLSKGKDISTEEFDEIREFAQFSYGKNMALYFLSFKQRTRKEVGDYLRKHGIDEEHLNHILLHLEKENWLDDQQYAQTYIQQNEVSGDKGPMVLRQKLQTKGIEKEVIQAALDKMDFSELAERVADKLERKYAGKFPQRALKEKILQGLLNRGFSYDLAQSTLSKLVFATDEEEEIELLERELDKQYRKYSRKYDGYDLKQRLIQALLRKGYDFSQIQSVLRDYL